MHAWQIFVWAWRLDTKSVICCRELAETILDSGDTLLTILGDILDFSKIDHNSMVLESAPVIFQTLKKAPASSSPYTVGVYPSC